MRNASSSGDKQFGAVAVTGGAGFIGSHLVEALLDGGNAVKVIDDFDPYYDGKEENLKSVLAHPCLTLERLDILDTEALKEALERAEVVFHLAAQPGVRFSFDNAEKTESVNVDGTQSVLEAAWAAGVRRLVFASSSSVYGLLEKLPVSETQVPRPISPYGESKVKGEKLCRQYCAWGRIETVALRLFSVFGPRQRPDMAGTRFLKKLTSSSTPLVTGDGMQTRDFTYVSDVVKAFIAAARSDRGVGEVFNIGAGKEAALQRFLSLIVEFLGLEESAVEYTESGKGEPGRMRCDALKALDLLGWRARVGLTEGVRRQVGWWVNERMSTDDRSRLLQRTAGSLLQDSSSG